MPVSLIHNLQFSGLIMSAGENSNIEIPAHLVGHIIGKQGSNIKSLEQQSGARLKQEESLSEGKKRLMISGDAHSQKKSRILIEESLSEFQNKFDSSSECKPVVYTPVDLNQYSTSVRSASFYDSAFKRQAEYRRELLLTYPKIEKIFYVEHKEVASMTKEEVDRFREDSNRIIVMNGREAVPNPVKEFYHAFESYPEILKVLDKNGFRKPTPIQCQAWPIIMQGYDFIGIAQTGTGKTLAFLLPALIHISSQPTPMAERTGPTALVIAPTRELAQQIESEVKKYPYRDINSLCVMGGASRSEQAKQLRDVEIVIATPGRLNDFIASNSVTMKYVSYVVLDEADRMLDLGFEPQIRKTLETVRRDKQMIMTSATWPEGVRRLSLSFMSEPLQVRIGSLDLTSTHSVTQEICVVYEDRKTEKLLNFLRQLRRKDKAIVFVARKETADMLSVAANCDGIESESLHGGHDQSARESALEYFREGKISVLVATDLASRGLDIDDVTHVFNFDFPMHIEEYVHRIGRTGRAGKSGHAITLMTRRDSRHATDLIKILEEAGQKVPKELFQLIESHERWKANRRGSVRGYRGKPHGFA